MKIGLHMLALQAPGSRGRGIGRYARDLVSALAEESDGAELFAYTVAGEPTDDLPDALELATRTIGRPGRPLAIEIERLLLGNPDDLDWWVELSPFELYRGYRPPRGTSARPRRAAVVYDFIPFRFPHLDSHDPPYARRLLPSARALSTYDAFLCISQSTRDDLIDLLGIDPSRARVIGGATSPCFQPGEPGPLPWCEREALARLGIDAPFVFTMGGRDPHKNLGVLIDAFAMLDRPIRECHLLVIGGDLGDALKVALIDRADRLAIGGRLKLTGTITDDDEVTLYRRCRAYLSASLHEGLGLPALEAMRCGAVPIVAGNSAQGEVVGDGGEIVPSSESRAIAERLGRRLDEGGAAEAAVRAALDRSESFSWPATAREALRALREVGGARGRAPRTRQIGRVALVSPLPPNPSGVADHAEALGRALARSVEVEYYHPGPGVPAAALRADGPPCFSARLLKRRARCMRHDAAVFHVGNSHHYHPIFRLLAEHVDERSVVVLHDPCLAGYRHWLSRQAPEERSLLIGELLSLGHGDLTPLALAEDPDPFAEACAARELTLTRRTLGRAAAIVVHSRDARDRLVPTDLRPRTFVVPLLARPMPALAPLDRAIVRSSLGIDPDSLLVLAAGAVHPSRMLGAAAEAFADLLRSHPRAVFLLAGEEQDGGALRDRVRDLGIDRSARLLGRVDDARYRAILGIADLAICLRRPPTRGESSAALLDLLAAGVPTIHLDVDAFAEVPDDVAIPLRWSNEGDLIRDLSGALRDLIGRDGLRAALSSRARTYASDVHGPAAVVGLYRDIFRRLGFACV